MALFGFDVKTISRLRRESVSKTTAYILRENVYDAYQGKTHYYSHVQDCIHKEILLPDIAPQEFRVLGNLLAEIDKAEKRYDARTGRVIRLTLPNDKEFSDSEQIALAKTFVMENFVSRGMCAIMAVHEGRNSDPAKNNPHVHVILTDRPVDANGFCTKKDRSWNRWELVETCRQRWAELQNTAYREKGMEIQVSHKSLEVQGIAREPTLPLGRAATALERKGIQTERGNRNREILAKQREREEQRILHRKRNRKRSR